MDYSTFGRHVAVDVWGIPFRILNNGKLLEEYLLNSAAKCGATIISSQSHQFEPQGTSVFVLLAESHLSIHTYPEKGYAAIDCYTCGRTIDPNEAVQYLIEQLKPTHVDTKMLLRGTGKIEVKNGKQFLFDHHEKEGETYVSVERNNIQIITNAKKRD